MNLHFIQLEKVGNQYNKYNKNEIKDFIDTCEMMSF